MAKYKAVKVPSDGSPIKIIDKKLVVPDNPIIPVIEGDGIGRDIMRATRRVVDAAVEKQYGGNKRIVWFDIYAGEKAREIYGEPLPDDTLKAIKEFTVALKGPLTTPVGDGFRSINVTLRRKFNLFACIRPVRYFKGVPSPMKHPELLDVVIFRENTEDVYAGIEWPKGSAEVKKVMEFLVKKMKVKIRPDSGIGIKPISATGSKRLVRKAIQYAIANNRRSVTLMHKGNIMKYTEGAFRDWGYEVAKKEFGEYTVTDMEVKEQYGGKAPPGKIIIKDQIADAMFHQVIIQPDNYDVVATTNLNGDYLSDACAAQVGGLGMAPGANIGDFIGVFEAAHGTAPSFADKDIANPSSLILSASLMLEYIGWPEAARLIEKGIEKTIASKTVTADLERLMEGATRVTTSQFASNVINNL
ncbi:MAG: isocitrate dehydrogenase (NADP(+)) [candidate division Zixibacteria bacterium]|nr:isocitrate dehydrogenase (NADP(+)) [candidate division Zixibacteria bacterium]